MRKREWFLCTNLDEMLRYVCWYPEALFTPVSATMIPR